MGKGLNLNAGIAFDFDGYFYVAESGSGNIYRFTRKGTKGKLFVSADDFEGLLGSMPGLQGGIVWSATPNPEPGTMLLFALGAAGILWRQRRRRPTSAC